MSIGWYDPITERWHRMPEPPAPPPPVPPRSAALQYLHDIARGVEMSRFDHVWRAVVATATASQQGDGCERAE